jgi:hypothetical protein
MTPGTSGRVTGGRRPAVPDSATAPWIDWLHAHAKPQPGWVQGWEWLACVTPVPPRSSRPAWLLGELFPDQELILRRVELWRCPAPGFQVISGSARDLGLITGTSAAMIELAVSEGITPRVSVAAASASAAPENALRLFLDILVWFAPGDQRGTPLPCAERPRRP